MLSAVEISTLSFLNWLELYTVFTSSTQVNPHVYFPSLELLRSLLENSIGNTHRFIFELEKMKVLYDVCTKVSGFESFKSRQGDFGASRCR